MTADVLRQAAALMRERAEGASPGPWEVIGGGEYVTPIGVLVAPDDGGVTSADAAHVASWHPAVALAVADWLDRKADRAEDMWLTHGQQMRGPEWLDALAVARAYLGSAS